MALLAAPVMLARDGRQRHHHHQTLLPMTTMTVVVPLERRAAALGRERSETLESDGQQDEHAAAAPDASQLLEAQPRLSACDSECGAGQCMVAVRRCPTIERDRGNALFFLFFCFDAINCVWKEQLGGLTPSY
jgi:hypothetical protein